ncbi:phage tail assembly protein [Paenibacillus sp. FJAT-26967]|uniref:phage tail assembly protein n=1 Tax=Paenibacillus sp. FJAT-26967 TaxID=1729690 RepID=UPI0008394D14|nr:phage tail assembly protein [Paenibacillus sp. FJAT-26967]
MKNEQNNVEEADERIYKLSRPFTFEGNEYTELTLDFEKLTGNDLLSCERQMQLITGASEYVPMKQISQAYQAVVTARAAAVPVELIQALPAKDFSKVTLRASTFLLA